MEHYGYKIRIYPNAEQRRLIQINLDARRFVYNHFLAVRRDSFQNEGISLLYVDTAKLLTALKKEDEYAWLCDADSVALQEALRDLDRSYKSFFRKANRYPRFIRKDAYYQSYRTRNQSDGVRVIDNSIRIPKVGAVKAKLSRPIDGRIRNATISKTGTGKYFVSLCVEEVPESRQHGDGVIGIDMGVKDFCITSNGDTFASHSAWRVLEGKLRRAHKAVSRKTKGSTNYNKARMRLAKVYERINNVKSDFQHKLTNRLCEENAFIACESLKIASLMRKNKHKGAKSIAHQSWGSFLSILEYKAERYGTVLVKIDTLYPSSQLCHVCGYKNSHTKNLKVRRWTCPVCGETHDRDINAAINILKEGLRIYEECEA